MSHRANYPHYQKAVEAYLAQNGKQFERLRKSNELSRPEQALLEARALSRKREWSMALDLLESLSTVPNGFLEAEREFLLGSMRFFLGDPEQAALHNLKALSTYTEIEDRRGSFLSAYNLSVDYSKMGLNRLSRHYLGVAERLASAEDEKVLVYRAMACELADQNEIDVALQWLEKAMRLREALKPNDHAALLAVACDIYFRAGQSDRALNVLEDAARSGVEFREKERMDFERCVLKSWKEGQPLGRPPRSLNPSASRGKYGEYGLKWELLRAVQSGERDRAVRLWDELRRAFPGIYGANFSFLKTTEERSVFGTCFKALCGPKSGSVLRRSAAPAGRAGRLLRVLAKSSIPLRKEELIEAVWGVPYEPSMDARFYKLIQRLREDSEIRILSANRAYILKH